MTEWEKKLYTEKYNRYLELVKSKRASNLELFEELMKPKPYRFNYVANLVSDMLKNESNPVEILAYLVEYIETLQSENTRLKMYTKQPITIQCNEEQMKVIVETLSGDNFVGMSTRKLEKNKTHKS